MRQNAFVACMVMEACIDDPPFFSVVAFCDETSASLEFF